MRGERWAGWLVGWLAGWLFGWLVCNMYTESAELRDADYHAPPAIILHRAGGKACAFHARNGVLAHSSKSRGLALSATQFATASLSD